MTTIEVLQVTGNGATLRGRVTADVSWATMEAAALQDDCALRNPYGRAWLWALVRFAEHAVTATEREPDAVSVMGYTQRNARRDTWLAIAIDRTEHAREALARWTANERRIIEQNFALADLVMAGTVGHYKAARAAQADVEHGRTAWTVPVRASIDELIQRIRACQNLRKHPALAHGVLVLLHWPVSFVSVFLLLMIGFAAVHYGKRSVQRL